MSLLRYLLNANKHEVQLSLNKGDSKDQKLMTVNQFATNWFAHLGKIWAKSLMHGVVFDPLKMGGLCMKITVITEVLMESF